MDAMLGAGLAIEKIILLKCTSEYPAEFADMNLLTISDMSKKFGVRIGLSDHSMGSLAPVVATALGAVVIEKHFCLSREMKNPDSEFSMEPAEFSDMVKDVHFAYDMKGTTSYGAQGNESASLVFRRSIFAVEDIKKGEAFSEENIRVIRPGQGMLPKYYDELIGKPSLHSYRKGEPIIE
jgi:sialic acid synthase SpsE